MYLLLYVLQMDWSGVILFYVCESVHIFICLSVSLYGCSQPMTLPVPFALYMGQCSYLVCISLGPSTFRRHLRWPSWDLDLHPLIPEASVWALCVTNMSCLFFIFALIRLYVTINKNKHFLQSYCFPCFLYYGYIDYVFTSSCSRYYSANKLLSMTRFQTL